jgi:uncharacterized LabA/DUF88 family protein
MSRNNKSAIFIDGSNLYATAKALRIDIDYKKLLTVFGDGLVRAFYYTAIKPPEIDPTTGEDRDNYLIPLIDWLSYNGYTLVSKPTKEFIDAQGRKKIKGNMDIEIAVDALELASHIDQAILFTGDGDFRSLVDALHRAGTRVTVVSTIATQPPMIADELRRVADQFIDLKDIAPSISQVGPRSRYG